MDAICETISDILEYFADSGDPIDPKDFVSYLEENGYMIVPIEDPTNLRFGVGD